MNQWSPTIRSDIYLSLCMSTYHSVCVPRIPVYRCYQWRSDTYEYFLRSWVVRGFDNTHMPNLWYLHIMCFRPPLSPELFCYLFSWIDHIKLYPKICEVFDEILFLALSSLICDCKIRHIHDHMYIDRHIMHIFHAHKYVHLFLHV